MLSHAVNKVEASSTQFPSQNAFTLVVLFEGEFRAERVARRDERAAVCRKPLVCKRQRVIRPVDAKRESQPWSLIVGLTVGQDKARR